jgi:RimJ/RimL family protein N-acetyltransferase
MNAMTKIPRIETERLILTWPSPVQIEQYYEDIRGNNMFETILWDGPSGVDDLLNYWKECVQTDSDCLELALNVAIIDKESNRYIGGASLRPVDKNPAFIDLGYALAPKYHGKGFATEAVGALVNEAFAKRKAERVFANAFVGNQASRNVVEKIGFKFEGVHRRAVLKRRVWLDEWSLAMTRPDWESRK